MFHFPSEVGVGIAYDAQRGGHGSAHVDHSIGLHELCGVIGTDAAQVAASSHTGSQLQGAEPRQGLHPRLITHNPHSRHRGEEPPSVVASHLRRTVGTCVHHQRIAFEQGVLGPHHERLHVRVVVIRVDSLPRTDCSRRDVLIAIGVGHEVRRRHVESLRLRGLRFGQCQEAEVLVLRDVECLLQRDVPQQVFALRVGTIGLAVAPHEGGVVVGVVVGVVGITAKQSHLDAVAQVHFPPQMGVEVSVLLVVLHFEHGQRVRYPLCFGHIVERSVCVSSVVEGGVEGVGRVEQFRLEGQSPVFLDAGKDAQVNGQSVAEGLLRHVEFGDIVSQSVGLDDRLVVNQSDGRAITACLGAATEGHVVVLHESRAGDGVAIVGGVSAVDDVDVHVLCRFPETVGREHVVLFVDRLKTDVAVVGDMEPSALALLGRHLDHAGCSTAAILRCLGGILQDGETLDVGGIDGGERRQVRRHAVDDHQRVVAARERCGSAHTHRRHHRLLVAAMGDLHTRRASVQGVERRDDQTFVHLLLGHFVDGSSQCVDVSRDVANALWGAGGVACLFLCRRRDGQR